MAHELTQAAELLERILEVSVTQRKYLDEMRIEELLATNEEREKLFGELMEINPECLKDGTLKSVTDEIIANDKVVYMNMESLLCAMKDKLQHIRDGSAAVRAYSKNA